MMTSGMITSGTVSFLKDLAENNNKPWFDSKRVDYEAAKKEFEYIVERILNELATKEPLFKEQKAKDCIFRIFRDVRFSKDKTPYKDHFGAYFSKGGKKFTGAGFYLHIQPGNLSFAGGGLWVPESPVLKSVRQEIDYHFKEFTKIIEDKKFKSFFDKINGDQLKTVPAGYSEDNPAIEYLKMKSFTVGHKLPDSVITGKDFIKKVMEVYTTMQPFVDFLNRAVS